MMNLLINYKNSKDFQEISISGHDIFHKTWDEFFHLHPLALHLQLPLTDYEGELGWLRAAEKYTVTC